MTREIPDVSEVHVVWERLLQILYRNKMLVKSICLGVQYQQLNEA